VRISDKLIASLELMRPANIVTAFADILAGFAVAGGTIAWAGGSLIPAVTLGAGNLAWLLLSTFGLYGGGVVFNDFFDAELDAEERPERPIPSGRISRTGAALLGAVLLALGVFSAFLVHPASGVIAAAVAILAVLYDGWAKHNALFGPLVMGSCRAGNLLLGVSILPAALLQAWYLALIPVAYIGAITLVSRGEVHGGRRLTGYGAAGLIVLVSAALAVLALRPDYRLLSALPFLLLFGIAVLPAFFRAARLPEPDVIRQAVKRGVLSLIILNSALAAGFAGILYGALVLLLLPLSLLLSRIFSVT